MLYPPCTLYVVECETPNTFYVGTTYRFKQSRYAEHFGGWGCKWTIKHGCRRIVEEWIVGRGEASQLENEKWMELARIHGPCRVRGGMYIKIQTPCPPGCCPKSLGAIVMCSGVSGSTLPD